MGRLSPNHVLSEPRVDVALVKGRGPRPREPRFVELNNEISDDIASRIDLAALQDIAGATEGVAALVGFACRHEGPTGRALHNAAAFLAGGKVEATHYKQLLPTYDVFDESRYFEAARSPQVVPYPKSLTSQLPAPSQLSAAEQSSPGLGTQGPSVST